MDRSDIAEKLKVIVEEQNEISIGGADDALDVDSFTMMLMISFVRDEYGVELDMDRLDFDAFLSLNTFADLVIATAEARAPAA